jgi:hypothetical protein
VNIPTRDELRPWAYGLGAALASAGAGFVLPLEASNLLATAASVGLLVGLAVHHTPPESNGVTVTPFTPLRQIGSRRLMREQDLPRFPPAHASEAARLTRPATGPTVRLDEVDNAA